MNLFLLDSRLCGDLLWHLVAIFLPPENVFGDDLRQLTAICKKIEDYLARHGVNFAAHLSHMIVCTITNGPSVSFKEKMLVTELPIDIHRRRASQPKQPIAVSSFFKGSCFHYTSPERVAHNMAMSLKNSEAIFAGKTMDCSDKNVDEYYHIARNYRLPDEQKSQFVHYTISKDAPRFYRSAVASNVSAFLQTVRFNGAGLSSSAGQACIKNHLESLRIADFVAKGKEVSEALTIIYWMTLKVSMRCAYLHCGDAHRVIFFDPFSFCATGLENHFQVLHSTRFRYNNISVLMNLRFKFMRS